MNHHQAYSQSKHSKEFTLSRQISRIRGFTYRILHSVSLSDVPVSSAKASHFCSCPGFSQSIRPHHRHSFHVFAFFFTFSTPHPPSPWYPPRKQPVRPNAPRTEKTRRRPQHQNSPPKLPRKMDPQPPQLTATRRHLYLMAMATPCPMTSPPQRLRKR